MNSRHQHGHQAPHGPHHAHGADQGHGHSHHHGHDAAHDHTDGVSENRLALAAVLTGLFMLAEVGGGMVSGSLALIADAGHMLTDFAGLMLAWFGFRLARRPADWKRSYGWDRFSVLAAFTNGMALFAIAAWIVVEAFHRLMAPAPEQVLGGIMLWVAAAGLAVNIVVFWILSSGDRDNLNIRAAMLHVAGDLLGSVAAIVAALVILATGWTPIDPILSVLVALIILRSAWVVVAQSGHILLESVPDGIDTRALAEDLVASVPGVVDVHHVHVWSISQKRPIITLHARISEGASTEWTTAALKRRLQLRHGMDHATIQIERGTCVDLDDSRHQHE
ncbi:MAG: cation diffusion facilitator family transporter [Hyphomicrobiaceae bacterium]